MTTNFLLRWQVASAVMLEFSGSYSVGYSIILHSVSVMSRGWLEKIFCVQILCQTKFVCRFGSRGGGSAILADTLFLGSGA
jgi:hypothetical protein